MTRKMGGRYVQDRPMGCGYLQGEPYFILKGDRLKANTSLLNGYDSRAGFLVLHATGTNV